MCIRVGGQLGPPFKSCAGVKQGDPLSPLLFGLFIDRFHDFLMTRQWERPGICLGGELISAMFYADDLVLMADSPAQLTQLLNALDVFCVASGMKVNAQKSEVVIFNRSQMHASVPTPCWHIAGAPLKLSDEFSYLGIYRICTTQLLHVPCARLCDVLSARAELPFHNDGTST